MCFFAPLLDRRPSGNNLRVIVISALIGVGVLETETAAGQRVGENKARTVTVAQDGSPDVLGADSATLQRAMDLLRTGDTLEIGPGTYRMNNSLFVPSGVTVRGTKGLTVLRKSAGAESALIEDGDYGETRLIVAEPGKFR
eukprot:gene50971-69347_t